MLLADLNAALVSGKALEGCSKKDLQIIIAELLFQIKEGVAGGISGVTGVKSGNGEPSTHDVGQILYVQLDSDPAGIIWFWNGSAWV